MSTQDNNEVSKLSKEELRKQLRDKLHSKIKQKEMGRMNVTKKKKEIDDYCNKIGVSESDIKVLSELSEKFLKNNKINITK